MDVQQPAPFYGGWTFSAFFCLNESRLFRRRWVRGDDLIALGMKPGPKFGQILEAVETRQLEGKLRTREEAIDWVKREYSLGKMRGRGD